MAQTSRVLQPLSMGDLFDEVFSLYRNNFVLIVGITGLVNIPINIFTKLWESSLVRGSPFRDITSTDLVTPVVLLLLSLVSLYLSQAALTKAIAERYLGHASSIASAYNFALHRFFPFVGTLFLVGLAWVVGVVTLIGWIFVFFWLIFVNPVFVVEDRAFGDAMGRSRELAKQNWGRIFLVGLLIALLTWVVSLGIGLFSRFFFGAFPQGIQAVLAGVIEGLAEALATPIGLSALVLLYFDIRVRKEGYDLEILAQEMAARAAGTPGNVPPPTPP
ncbi:hypothetical protein HYR54_16155 [Candidatus Acetothermia bacterium]|nr:hypothetical protein [Candidatus Acetothermia bacterium]